MINNEIIKISYELGNYNSKIIEYIEKNGIPNKVYISEDLINSEIHQIFSQYSYVYTHQLLPENYIVFDDTLSTYPLLNKAEMLRQPPYPIDYFTN